ncbi:hypothetical protein G6F42_020085 [Rhizopus arrhizus]|nr:hypothetical protein G6F42_020085 [Rhizopus arrhizus]
MRDQNDNRYLLTPKSAMFIGGELGNPDCWFVPPNFIRKYWFLCPNYRPTRPDNSVELAVFFAQRMIDSLKRRKEMYIMRDKHMEYFLQPNLDMGLEEEDDEDSEDQQSAVFEQHDRIDMLVINNINKDIPRIISPNAFTV